MCHFLCAFNFSILTKLGNKAIAFNTKAGEKQNGEGRL